MAPIQGKLQSIAILERLTLHEHYNAAGKWDGFELPAKSPGSPPRVFRFVEIDPETVVSGNANPDLVLNATMPKPENWKFWVGLAIPIVAGGVILWLTMKKRPGKRKAIGA